MIYIVNIFLLFFWNALLKPKTNNVKKKQFLGVAFVQLFLISTFRNYTVGFDSKNYYDMYLLFKSDAWKASYVSTLEPGYVATNKLVYMLAGERYWVLWGVMTLLVLLPVVYFFYHYSKDVFLSICIYICFGYYYNSMNQVRQMVAVSICMLAYMALDKKKYILCIIFIMLAMSFHNSAIIFLTLPLIVVFKKYLNKRMLFFASVVLVGVYFNFEKILAFITRYYREYNVYFTEKSLSTHLSSGVSAYLGLYLMVLLVAFEANRKNSQLFKENMVLKWQMIMVVIAEFIMILGMKIHIVNRFALYFEIYMCVLLANIYPIFSKGRYRKIWNVILICMLFLINYYYLFVAENGYGRAGIIPYMLYKN